MKNWQQDKADSDRFLPEMKRIIGEHLISEPPIEEDQQRNTDLVVLKLDAVRVACRVRANNYLKNYGWEFTVRSSRNSGCKTEYAKIVEGWGDYMLYGFACPQHQNLARWFLISLNDFRLWAHGELVKNKGAVPGFEKRNHDGSSNFRCFNLLVMPKSVLFASSEPVPYLKVAA